MMNNTKYQNGKIYRITDNGYNLFYYGSTIQPLAKRMNGHRRKYTLYKSGEYHNMTIFSIFDEYGTADCKIELVEEYPCNNKMELFKREGWHIQNNECVNKVIAGRTMKEWCQDNKEKTKMRCKDWYEANKPQYLERVKHYRNSHKDEIKDYRKHYYEANKERLKEQQSVKIICPVCNVCYLKCGRTRHEQTMNHTRRLHASTGPAIITTEDTT